MGEEAGATRERESKKGRVERTQREGSHCEQKDLGEGAHGEQYNSCHLTKSQENPHYPSLHLELEFYLSGMQGLATRLSEGEEAQSYADHSGDMMSQ